MSIRVQPQLQQYTWFLGAKTLELDLQSIPTSKDVRSLSRFFTTISLISELLTKEILVTITNTNKTLLRHLETILKSYYSLKTERDSKLKDILTQFGETSCLKYSLDNHTSLVLTKDERSLNSKRRFKNSPFPLLTNIEYFSSSVGD